MYRQMYRYLEMNDMYNIFDLSRNYIGAAIGPHTGSITLHFLILVLVYSVYIIWTYDKVMYNKAIGHVLFLEETANDIIRHDVTFKMVLRTFHSISWSESSTEFMY